MNFLVRWCTLVCAADPALGFRTARTQRLIMRGLQQTASIHDQQNEDRTESPITKPKVLIVGAGFSGLAVAYYLRDVAECRILEARDRIGGRVHPMKMDDGTIVDLGGQWVHEASDKNPMVGLMKELNIPMLYASLEEKKGDLVEGTSKDSNNTRRSTKKNTVFDASGKEIPVGVYKSACKFFYKALDSIDPEVVGVKTSWKDVLDESLNDSSSPNYHRLAGQNSRDPQFQAVLNYLVHRAECYEGGRFHELSSHLNEIYVNLGGPDEIPTGGYNAVLDAVEECIGSDRISLNTQVKTVETLAKEEGVRVICQDGTNVLADYCVCTVPLGVLQKRAIMFQPNLPNERWDAIDSIGMGLLDKVILKFDRSFWDGFQVFGVVHEEVSRIQHFYDCTVDFGAPTLILFLGGDAARRVDSEGGLADEDIVAEAMGSLRSIFGNNIPEPKSTAVTRWLMDAYSYGSYSFAKVGCTESAYEEVAKPIGRLFFAGEHTSLTAHSCVHGAWGTGEREAKQIARVIQQASALATA